MFRLAEIGEKFAFFGVNFILQTFYQCKKNDKYQVWFSCYVIFSLEMGSCANFMEDSCANQYYSGLTVLIWTRLLPEQTSLGNWEFCDSQQRLARRKDVRLNFTSRTEVMPWKGREGSGAKVFHFLPGSNVKIWGQVGAWKLEIQDFLWRDLDL